MPMLEDIKKTLRATADKLRANMDAAEYKHLVLGLIFVNCSSDPFHAKRAEPTQRLKDLADEYFIAGLTPELLTGELEAATTTARSMSSGCPSPRADPDIRQ
jgi:type I restriction enzyme M protein